MAYHGTNDDRRQADEIYASYIEKMSPSSGGWSTAVARSGCSWGTPATTRACRRSWRTLRAQRPDLEPDPGRRGTGHFFCRTDASNGARRHRRRDPLSQCDLRAQARQAHISLGYAEKNIALMADAGLSEFCQSTNSLDVDLLIQQFTELENRSAQLRQTIAERNVTNAQLLDDQFAELSAILFPADEPARAMDEHKPARSGACLRHQQGSEVAAPGR